MAHMELTEGEVIHPYEDGLMTPVVNMAHIKYTYVCTHTYIHTYIYIYIHIHISYNIYIIYIYIYERRTRLLLATEMAKVGGPLLVLKVCSSTLCAKIGYR